MSSCSEQRHRRTGAAQQRDFRLLGDPARLLVVSVIREPSHGRHGNVFCKPDQSGPVVAMHDDDNEDIRVQVAASPERGCEVFGAQAATTAARPAARGSSGSAAVAPRIGPEIGIAGVVDVEGAGAVRIREFLDHTDTKPGTLATIPQRGIDAPRVDRMPRLQHLGPRCGTNPDSGMRQVNRSVVRAQPATNHATTPSTARFANTGERGRQMPAATETRIPPAHIRHG